jgi:hypothetical protein
MQGSTLDRIIALTTQTRQGQAPSPTSCRPVPVLCSLHPYPLLSSTWRRTADLVPFKTPPSPHLNPFPFLSPSLLPTASQSSSTSPIDEEGYHFEGLLPTFLVGTSISTTTITDRQDRPTARTIKFDKRPPTRTDRQNDPVHQPPRPIPTIYDPETRPRPSPQLSSSTTYPQASINV